MRKMSTGRVDDEDNKPLGVDRMWDDKVLVQAYDGSSKLTRETLAKRLAAATNRKENMAATADADAAETGGEGEGTAFNVGDFVRATYDDGVDYEAEIVSIDEMHNTCLIKYFGYDNEQDVLMTDLVPSWGNAERLKQFAEAKVAAAAEETHETVQMPHTNQFVGGDMPMPPPPMPPMPPMLVGDHDAEESEHLSAMMMSWYMSGYYTGLYQGMKVAKSRNKKSTKK